MRINGLCKTLGGNICYCLTITNNIDEQLSSEEELTRYKK